MELQILLAGLFFQCQDWANPETRKFIHVYPEIPEDGIIREIWHAQKWRKDMDLDRLSPMYDARHLHAHFYVNELARLNSGKLVIPIRWLKFRNRICADAFCVDIDVSVWHFHSSFNIF